MKRILYLLLLTALPLIGNAQVGIGTTTPDSSAALHIKSNSKGLLIPQISDTAVVYQPTANGLLVFIKDEGKFYAYDTIRGNWQCINPLTSNSETGQLSPTEPYTSFTGNGTVPLGGIIMWSGTQIPDGWALCDGDCYNREGILVQCSEGIQTPNLSGRFILGYGTDYNQAGNISEKVEDNTGNIVVGDTGGVEEYSLKEDNIPRHRHDAGTIDIELSHELIWEIKDSLIHPGMGYLYYYGTNHTRVSVIPFEHTHRIEGATGDYGANPVEPIDNRPPYYVLAFIMRLR